MKKLFLITILLINSICFTQNDTILLPKKGVDFFDKKTRHYTVHITNNIEIYFNSEKILFWDQLSTKILEEVRTPKMNAVKNITVYADKKLDYYILERVRSEIGKVWTGFLHFMSDDVNNKNCLSFYIKGSPLSQKKYTNTDWTYGHNLIFTTKQRLLEDDVVFSKVRAEVEWPIFAVWQSNFLSEFYSGDVNLINRFLTGIKHVAISILSKEYFQIKDEKISFKDNKIKKLVENNDIIFIDANRINYESYFSAMSNIQKLRYEDNSHGELKKPLIVEIPYRYQNELKNKGMYFNKN